MTLERNYELELNKICREVADLEKDLSTYKQQLKNLRTIKQVGEEHFKRADEIDREISQIVRKLRLKMAQMENLNEDYYAAYRIIFARGLSSERILRFERFKADNDECQICLDLKVGSEVVRLDCDSRHFMCENCAHKWFEEHNTCPVCAGPCFRIKHRNKRSLNCTTCF